MLSPPCHWFRPRHDTPHGRSRFGIASLAGSSLVLAFLVLVISLLLPLSESGAVDLYLRHQVKWEEGDKLPSPPLGSLPLLFVHGHATPACGPGSEACSCDDPGTDCEYYRRTWIDSLDNGLRSFDDAIDANPGLNIERYFLNLENNSRSIVEDARDIGIAVERIVARHNPAFAAAPNRKAPPDVQVAIIAHSKGTISTRLYLKSLQDPEYDLPGPYQNFHPVSEFIAIAPPNHGTVLHSDLSWGDFFGLDLSIPQEALEAWVFLQLFKESVQQLNNGFLSVGVSGGSTCRDFNPSFPSYPWPLNLSAIDFIEQLNGHAMEDTHIDTYQANGNTFGKFPEEAPGSRENGAPTEKGALYVVLYDAECRDGVGCHQPRLTDCRTTSAHGAKLQGRSVAINLAPNAVNIRIKEIDGGSDPALEGVEVHRNIVHYFDTICKALYTAAHHVANPDYVCDVNYDQIPIVPVP